MNKIISYIMLVIVACGCSRGMKFDIEGRLTDNAASVVYLVVENTSADTLASAAVADDNTFRLRGEVAEPSTAFVCDDNGNALAILLTEKDRLHLTPTANGYIAEGGPINDKYNIIVRRLSDVSLQIAQIDPQAETADEEYESLMMKYNEILSTAITDNLDNIIGVELFINQEMRSMSAEDMRVRLAQFTPKMKALSPMRRFAEYINTYERTEVGKQFTDVELKTISGEVTTLSNVCKGKWVLLDFWATWCDPCCREIPYLQEAYAKYAIQGFEICSISLDRDPARWEAFVLQNRMLWTNAIDIPQQDMPSTTEIYGLQSIPANFLISPEGTIVARDIAGEDLLHELGVRLDN